MTPPCTLFVIRLDGTFMAAFADLHAAELWSSFNLAFAEGEPALYRLDFPTERVAFDFVDRGLSSPQPRS